MEILNKQKTFLLDVSTKYLAYIGGYGSGKTYAGCYKAIILSMLNRGCAGMLVSPTYIMSKDIMKRTLLNILEDIKLNYLYKTQDNKVLLSNGSEIWFRSADNPDRLKGSNLAWVGLDEAGQMNKEIWDISIARVRDPKAKALQTFVTTTPEGFNFLYDIFGTNRPDHKTIKAKTEENTFLNPEYSQTLRENFDVLLQQQYLDGDFVNITAGRVYYSFDRVKHITSDYTPDHYLPLLVTCDFNINPCVWILGQKVNDNIIFFDELVVKDANTPAMCTRLEEKEVDKYVGLTFYGDYSSIHQRSTASSMSDWQIIENHFKNHRGYQRKLKSNPKIKDSVNVVNNLFDKNKISITKNCNNLIKDFEQVVWSENRAEIEKKKNPDLTHSSDASRYLLSYEYSLNNNRSYIH